MQQSPYVGHLHPKSSSPVFFTGCTTVPSRQESSTKTISPQDFENLKLSVNACKLTASRPALLPLPTKVVEANCFVNNGAFVPGDFDVEIAQPPVDDFACPQETIKAPIFPIKDSCLPTTESASGSYLLHNSHHDRIISNDLNLTNSYPKYPMSHNRKRKNISPERTSKLPRRLFSDTSDRAIWEQLSQDIWQLYLDNKQTPGVYQMKMELRDQLHDMLLTTFPNCGLYVVGSSMTGLGANSSDMDMCLMLTHSEIDQEQEATNILQTVYETFVQYDFLRDVELIPAKVPILRFKDSQSAIEVDLNINNSVGIRNTQLLTSYSRMDNRVPPLVLMTKLWARCHGINDAKNHSLSSYSLVLMVIHYLQYGCSPSVLPCLQILQPEKFKPNSDVRTLNLKEDLPPFVSENTVQLAELFLGFLDYFANKFDFQNDVMSIRVGSILPKHISMNNTLSPKNKRGHWKHLCIEEPFNLTNTACSVFKDSVFYYVRDVFLRSWNLLRSSGRLSSILDLRKR